MTHPEADEEFTAFLKRRSVLPGGTPAGEKLQPPLALDAAVLKKAREAIEAQHQSNRAPRWAMPVAIAATVLLCLSVVLNIRLNTSRQTENPERVSAANEGTRLQDAQSGAAPRNNGAPAREAILPETKVAGSLAPRPPVVAESAPGPTPAARTASAPAAVAPHPRDPQAWLRHIEALRAQGKNAQAEAEMRLFQATFPAHSAKPAPPAASEPPK